MNSVQIIEFDELDSTNLYLEKHINQFQDFTVVRSNYQSAGRGRHLHRWTSKKGEDLLLSILFKKERQPYIYTITATYALLKLLAAYSIEASIKFPNDIYVNNQKIAGILTKAIYQDHYLGTIVGIGLNVKNKNYIAMESILQTDIDLHRLMMQFIDIYRQYLQYDFRKIIEEVNAHSYLKGKWMYFKNYGRVCFIGLDCKGQVGMKCDEGIVYLPLNEITIGKL